MARAGLIGYGLAGAAFHAPLIAAVDGLKLAVIVTSDPDRQRQARGDHPSAAIVAKTGDLWQRAGEIDFVVIASPNRFHGKLALEAIEQNLHVVVDKPFTPTAGEAMRVIEAARARRRMLTVFHNRRWDGDFLTVRKLLAEGQLGDAYRFESRFERWRPEPRGGWRELGHIEEAGGLLYDLGSHLIDQALVLSGPARTVYAELHRRRPGVHVDDDAFVAITHASGVQSHLWMSAVAAQYGPRFRVLGSKAAYVKHGLDVQEAALRETRRVTTSGWGEEPREWWGTLGAGESVRSVPTLPGQYQRFYEGVRDAIGGGAVPVDPLDAVAGLKVIEAARVAALEGRVVHFQGLD